MVLGFVRTEKAKDSDMVGRINDAATCRVWLDTLVPIEAHLLILREFLYDLLTNPARANLTAPQKLLIVETVRNVIMNLLRDRLRDTELRSVLMTQEESRPLWFLLEAAEVLREAYANLVPSLPTVEEYDVVAAKRKPANVDALQRALDLNAIIILLHQRTRVMVPDTLWDRHCELGKLVRDFHCQDHEVADPTYMALTHSCRKAFVMPVLLALIDPPTLSTMELSMAILAAQLWSGKVAFRIDPAGSITLTARKESKPGPCVYLGQYRVRFDSQNLMRNIDRALGYLDDGKMPKEWARESRGNLNASKALLRMLKQRWGYVEPESINYPLHAWDKPSYPVMLAAVALQTDTQGERRSLLSTDPRGRAKSIYEYQQSREDRLTPVYNEVEQIRVQKLLQGAETWNLAGEKGGSLLCARRKQKPTLYLNQLVGIKLGKKDQATPYQLGWIHGMQQAISEDLNGMMRPSASQMVRVRLFPGQVLIQSVMLDEEDTVLGYLLVPPEFSVLGEELDDLALQIKKQPTGFSLILPVASFRIERPARLVIAGMLIELQLDELLARGLDFDRVSLKLRTDPLASSAPG